MVINKDSGLKIGGEQKFCQNYVEIKFLSLKS